MADLRLPAQIPEPLSTLPARKTIAFFGGSPGSLYNYEKWLMWRGVSERAHELGVNLIYIAGEGFLKYPQALLYEFVGPQNADGIIFWNSTTSPRIEIQEVVEFIQRYRPLPMVSIEREIPGCASILVDNAQGIRELITHLRVDHGYCKIGFVGENSSYISRERQSYFEDEMTILGSLDANLVGGLNDLDANGLTAGVDYEALVVYSDYIAVEVVERLQEKGVRVPEDVAVVGFNDGRDARGSQPPLTSVRIPFRHMGHKAVENLYKMIAGETRESHITFPTSVIPRRSCGCLEPLAEQAIVGLPAMMGEPIEGLISKRKVEIVAAMSDGIRSSVESNESDWANEIFDVIIPGIRVNSQENEIRPAPDVLRQLYHLLGRAVVEGVNVSRWHNAMTVIRRTLVPHLEGTRLAAAEDLFQQARVLIGQSAMRSEIRRNWQSERRGMILRDFESALLISNDFQELNDHLVDGLQRFGIHTFYLVLYNGPIGPEGQGRVELAYRNGKVDQDQRAFSLNRLLPEGYFGSEPFGIMVEALHLREEQIGYLIFQTDPPADDSDCEIYEALRLQLSRALVSVRLRERLFDALQKAEEANLLKSSFLSMVSHELRTPINLIVGLSEMAIRQQEKGGRQSLKILQKYHEQIYVSGQHLDRLIRDVLDLASSQIGQMKLIFKTFDLVPELRDAASMGEHLAEQKKLSFVTQIPDHLPLLWGDKTRIRQVLLNLLSNAVKFTAHGEVTLFAEEIKEGIHIAVSDTGLGISSEEQTRIFDEFQQGGRSIAGGYEGIGLGLAITRRLVEMHGGRIWVNSPGTLGSGSTFEIILPVKPGGGDGTQAESRTREGKVLILTSQGGSIDELSQHLSRQGFRVEELIGSTQDFDIDEWQRSPPGAVVLDMTPASEMGWEIMKRLKENPSTQDIPVLFYSLMVEQNSGNVVEMDYLNKPINIDELINALKRHGLRTGKKEEPTLLIVDDEPGILEMHTHMIRSFWPESRILTARDGMKAIEILRKTRPDLVLLDLLMPGMDGFGVIKTMQEEQSLRGIPVIVLSGQVLSEYDMTRLNQGVASVLGKGLFSRQEVLERIEKVLTRSQRVGSEGQRLVFQAMGFIQDHFTEDISRSDIAGHLSVNEQYLSRCFNKEIGIGPMAYLSRYRIEQAKRLLDEGKLSITQIALEVGISSQSYFSRIFQQETGVSPSAYQRRRGNLE